MPKPIPLTTDGSGPKGSIPVSISGLAGGASEVSWNDVSGKPTTFPPATHNHAVADVTGLQAALDGKADSPHTHTIAQVTGLQAIINDLTARIEALESAAG